MTAASATNGHSRRQPSTLRAVRRQLCARGSAEGEGGGRTRRARPGSLRARGPCGESVSAPACRAARSKGEQARRGRTRVLDELLGAVDDGVVPVLGARADVARHEPSVLGKRLARRLLVLRVPEHDIRAAEPQLARLALGHVLALGRDEARLDRRQELADRARLGLGVGRDHGDRRRLGHAEAVGARSQRAAKGGRKSRESGTYPWKTSVRPLRRLCRAPSSSAESGAAPQRM